MENDNNSWHQISHGFVVTLDNTARDLRNLADELARPFGLSNSRWLVLYVLESHGSALSQKELAAEIGIEGPTMVRILDGMERDGWVRRRVSEKDRRVKLIDVEEKTWEVMKQLSDKLDAAKEVMLKGISEQEMIEGTELLEHIRQQILHLSGRKASNSPCPKFKLDACGPTKT